MLGACCPGGGHILRADEVGGDLHEILDPHPGVGEDGDDVPPTGLSLRLDTVGDSSIWKHADFSRDVEKPRARGHLDGMAVGAEWRGHRSWSAADIHTGDPFSSLAISVFEGFSPVIRPEPGGEPETRGDPARRRPGTLAGAGMVGMRRALQHQIAR
jgi:hypothetical protein